MLEAAVPRRRWVTILVMVHVKFMQEGFGRVGACVC